MTSIHLPGYKVFTEGHTGQIRRAAQMMREAERPLVYAGGGIIAAGRVARNCANWWRLPTRRPCTTLMGLGALPSDHPNFISMPGMHGSYAANMALTELRPADRPGRALRRPRHRPPGRLRAARQGDPRGYRPGRNRQEPRARRAHRGRREARARASSTSCCEEPTPAGREASAAARRAWWRQIREWKDEHPLEPVVSDTRNQAAAPDGAKSTGSPAARPSSPPTWASTRCGRRS